jgi:polar amino acid transport system substrate-binding protein
MSVATAAARHDLAGAGRLRVAVNLGNAVLAGGTPADPSGVSVDLAREIARRLGVEASLVCFDAARKSEEALRTGVTDLAFLAIEPEREAELAFTAPYVLIEGVYVVSRAGAIASPQDVDRHGVRVGVKRGSAYDLHLTRSLGHAEIVRGEEGVEVYRAERLEVGAGIRQPVTAWVGRHPGHRVLEPAFMQIRQAIAVRRGLDAATLGFLDEVVGLLKGSGFVADSLARAGHSDVTVAP